MIFALLTLLSALSLAAVAGWFSIAGIVTIYAGAPLLAIVLGIVTECAKLVTTSWLYRNWGTSTWKIKLPLIYFTVVLMVITSIGVFGFLSKAHLDQNAGTVDNSAKVEQLQRQIDREKSIIADNERVINQLDATVNSYLGKDRADRSVSIRRSQAPQRKQLKDEITQAQAKIDQLSEEKFKYESELRKLELEVGPIRYIAELAFGADGNQAENLSLAIKIFTLLIVSSLDPLAIVLLIAANSSLARLKEKKKDPLPAEDAIEEKTVSEPVQAEVVTNTEIKSVTESQFPLILQNFENEPLVQNEKETVHIQTNTENRLTSKTWVAEDDLQQTTQEAQGNQNLTEDEHRAGTVLVNKGKFTVQTSFDKDEPDQSEAASERAEGADEGNTPVDNSPIYTEITVEFVEPGQEDIDTEVKKPWAQQTEVLSELLGNQPHFEAKRVVGAETNNSSLPESNSTKYRRAQSWLTEFKGVKNGKQ